MGNQLDQDKLDRDMQRESNGVQREGAGKLGQQPKTTSNDQRKTSHDSSTGRRTTGVADDVKDIEPIDDDAIDNPDKGADKIS